AAGEHRDRTGILTLGTPQPLAAFLVAPGGDGAAVHHKDVGLLVGAGQCISVLTEKLGKRAGLILIDLAAQRIKTYAHGFAPFSDRKILLLYYRGEWQKGKHIPG